MSLWCPLYLICSVDLKGCFDSLLSKFWLSMNFYSFLVSRVSYLLCAGTAGTAPTVSLLNLPTPRELTIADIANCNNIRGISGPHGLLVALTLACVSSPFKSSRSRLDI